MESRATGLPSLFSGLTPAEQEAFLARATARNFAAQTVIYREGEPAQSLLLIRSGRVALTCTSPKGRHILLRLLAPEDAMGITTLLAESEHVATAVALTPVSTYFWDQQSVQSSPVYPRLLQNGFRLTLQYLKEYGERHVGLLTETAEQRLARTLTRLGGTNGRILTSGVEVEISNDDLGALSDVGMFTTSRQLKRWERDGHIVKRRRRVLIRQPNGLDPQR